MKWRLLVFLATVVGISGVKLAAERGFDFSTPGNVDVALWIVIFFSVLLAIRETVLTNRAIRRVQTEDSKAEKAG